MKWTTKFPTKEGIYWFYGYRYGKVSCGSINEPEWMVIRFNKCANTVIGEDGKGQFFYEKEITEGHFSPLDLPEFPQVSEPFTESCKKCYGNGTVMGNKTCPDCLGECGK